MKKIQIFAVFFLFLIYSSVFAQQEEVHIISRAEWGANETLRNISSPEWQNIIKTREENALKPLTDAQKLANEKEALKNKKISEYFSNNFPLETQVIEKVSYENGEKLAWPIQKTKYVKGIVIHHTDTNYETSLDSIQKIYRFHAISRAWGDIGYNYLIGYDGEIYEGRAGGDYAVGAHAVYNNFSTVSISLIGEYDEKGISDKQYESLSKLVLSLATKYGIDLNEKVYFHKECISTNCSQPMNSFESYPIVGHRDVGYTACPGGKLYAQIQQILKENQPKTAGFQPVAYGQDTQSQNNSLASSNQKTIEKYKKIFEKKNKDSLLLLLSKIEEYLYLDKVSANTKKKLQILKIALTDFLKQEFDVDGAEKSLSYDDNETIKIRLSYPGTGAIDIKDGSSTYSFTVDGDALVIKDKQFKQIELRPKKRQYLEISSWERIPQWDITKTYNDNKFRGSLILGVVDGKLQVVNKLTITDYLKGLGEVSNSDEIEKIKTIVIAARTYARYYLTRDRKFPGTDYDGSDNPDEFQNYLGYEYEKRSPKVVQVVEETKDEVITQNDIIIKPWYFHSSDGVTRSYTEYCVRSTGDLPSCKNFSKNYPYLVSRRDIGSIGKSFSGHGVGISGNGSTYLAKNGWSAEMIVSYYLKGTAVKVKNF